MKNEVHHVQYSPSHIIKILVKFIRPQSEAFKKLRIMDSVWPSLPLQILEMHHLCGRPRVRKPFGNLL